MYAACVDRMIWLLIASERCHLADTPDGHVMNERGCRQKKPTMMWDHWTSAQASSKYNRVAIVIFLTEFRQKNIRVRTLCLAVLPGKIVTPIGESRTRLAPLVHHLPIRCISQMTSFARLLWHRIAKKKRTFKKAQTAQCTPCIPT